MSKTAPRRMSVFISAGTRVTKLPVARSLPTNRAALTSYGMSIGGESPDSSYATDREAPPEEGMYCFMIQRSTPDRQWRFVHVSHNRLGLYDHPRQFFRRPSEAMKDLWHATAIEGTIYCDEPADFSSLRLFRIQFGVEDVSRYLFNHDDRRDRMRMAAVAKLSDAEARALGLVREKALLKLHQSGGDQQQQNQKIFDSLANEAEELSMSLIVDEGVRRAPKPKKQTKRR